MFWRYGGRLKLLASSFVIVASAFASVGVQADEGMWTYDHVPFKLLQERYSFKPTQEWLDHLRLSSISVHASASFVSPDGLILTNHHVVVGYIQRLSTPEHNYVREGFYAKTRAEEIPIPGASVRVLQSIEDVTSRVEAAVPKNAMTAQAADQRAKIIAAIESECLKNTGFEGEVVAFFGGATYSLYRYKRFTNIRFVFAPEDQAANFGGDFDNFTYPRHDLDMAFLRAYGDEQAKTSQYLKVNPEGAKDGELVFASGHPGKTDRQFTISVLEYLRDVSYPAKIARTHHAIDVMNAYSARGTEENRKAKIGLYYLANSLKAREGELRGLRDPALMSAKGSQERTLREAVDKDPELKRLYGGAWDRMRMACEWARAHQNEILDKTEMYGRFSGAALTMVRYADEVRKPDSDRLPGYHNAELPDTLRRLESPQPYHKDLEEILMADTFQVLLKDLGPGDPYIKIVLQGRSPAEVAREVMSGTKLDDVEVRKALLKDEGKAVLASKDPLIELVRRADPTVRAAERDVRNNFDAVQNEALTQIAKAEFAVYGEGAYPDATGTLRLAFGKVAGYPFATTLVPPFTTFYGLYDRAGSFGNKGDFKLAPSEEKSRDKLDLRTPLNLVCTADITGGNSGSPLVDGEGRLVGLVFDGNMESHPNVFVYDETQARCVAVDIRGILEALRKLYGADALVQEMLTAAK